MLRTQIPLHLIKFLALFVLPLSINAQNRYNDLEPITSGINTHNHYVVTSNTLEVRLNGNYHKTKAGISFYTLKKGDIVRVSTARKGKFAGKEGEWFEISHYDKNGKEVYVPRKELWQPNSVRGIVDANHLKEIKMEFFTINSENVSVELDSSNDIFLIKGDTIIAEVSPFYDVHAALVIDNKQMWFSKPVASGGSTEGGALDKRFLDEIEDQDSLRHHDYKLVEFFTEGQHKSYISGIIMVVLFVFFLVGTLIFILLSGNKPKYSFNFDNFKIDGKLFYIEIIKGKVLDINRYQRAHYSSTSGRVYQSGNTINVTAPRVDVTTSNHSEIWLEDSNGQEHLVTRNYDINSARVGSVLSWLKLKNGFTLGLLYHNLGRYSYTRHPYLKNVIDLAVTKKFSFIKFGSVLSLCAIVLYLIIEFGFSNYHSRKVIFGYDDPSIHLFGFSMKTFVFQFIVFSALLLFSYYIILSIKKGIALKRVSKKLEQDIIVLCEKLISK